MALKDQVALVLGGASGIGLATVKLFLQEGARVVIADVSSSGEATTTQLEEEFGLGRCVFVQTDVRDEAQMEAAFVTAKKKFNGLDIFINSAGIKNDFDWNLSVDINIKGSIRGMLLAWKHMGKHEGGNGGVVANLSSLVGVTVSAYIPVYTATKHAVVGLSRACGEPLHVDRTGVRVIVMCPSQTDTPMIVTSRQPTMLFPEYTEERDRLITTFYSQRPESVAKGILHVVQHAASGSIWMSEDDLPVYEVAIPSRQDMRVDK